MTLLMHENIAIANKLDAWSSSSYWVHHITPDHKVVGLLTARGGPLNITACSIATVNAKLNIDCSIRKCQ